MSEAFDDLVEVRNSGATTTLTLDANAVEVVAGGVSDAGSVFAGDSAGNRRVVLAGEGHGPVSGCDLLTTSPTPGHAVLAADQARAFGAVLGKAMGSLARGRSLVPVLVSR